MNKQKMIAILFYQGAIKGLVQKWGNKGIGLEMWQ